MAGLTMLLVGPAYGWQQYVAYVRFLAEMTANFPWRTPESGFLGYNHSILQITFYLLGVTPAATRLAFVLKLLFLLPLGLVSLRHMVSTLDPARRGTTTLARPGSGRTLPRLSLDLAFVFYAGAFIWLDIVWEMTLGIVIFAYLLATLESRAARAWAWAIFLPYALLDLWQILTFAGLGSAIFTSGLYIWTDPSIYLPMVMIVIITFYLLLLKRLWVRPIPATEPLLPGYKSAEVSETSVVSSP
jgi:hypothetical protein